MPAYDRVSSIGILHLIMSTYLMLATDREFQMKLYLKLV